MGIWADIPSYTYREILFVYSGYRFRSNRLRIALNACGFRILAMTAMEGEAGTQRVHVIEPHHPPPQVHTVWCFPSGLYRGHSLLFIHPTLRLRVELFNENHHAISIHGPRKKSMIRTESVSAVQYKTRIAEACDYFHNSIPR